MYIDAHVHVGDYNAVNTALKGTVYKQRYRLYSALNAETVQKQEEYLQQLLCYFAIPIVLKEIGIKQANIYLQEFCKTHESAIPVFFVGDEENVYKQNSSIILKEHFLHHDSEEWINRRESYEYLSSVNGFLLIHSADKVRKEYIKTLRKNFPKMNIIIAHMGRNVFEEFDYTTDIINCFKDDRQVFFDISTVKNDNIILYALNTIGDERILFGSDFPYECKSDVKLWDFTERIKSLDIPKTSKDNIFYKNAIRIVEG